MEWIKARWEGIMFQQNYYYFEKVCSNQQKLFGGSCRILSCVHEPKAYWFCYREDYDLEFGKLLVEKFLKDEGFYGQFKQDYMVAIRTLGKANEDMEEKRHSLAGLSNKELSEIYLSIIDKSRVFATYTMTCEPVELFLEQRLRQKIAEIIKSYDEAADELYSIFTAPDRLSFLQEERNEIIELADAMRTEGEKRMPERLPEHVTESIKRHARKWWWIRHSYMRQERQGEEFFVSELRKIIETGESKVSPQFSEEKQGILDQIEADDELRMFVQISGDYIHFRDLRKAELIKCIYYVNLIISELAGRLGLSFDDAAFMTYNEIIDASLGRISIPYDKIKMRKTAVSTYDEKGAHVWYGEEAAELRDEIFGTVETGASELEGTSASPGSVTGRVRVLMSSSEADEFQEGEILVTSNTAPDWVVIMRKAAAIITERGGITCHAAIISRELGIPCITGVQNVTEILKDGEIVEVDATKGIIKRLK